MNPDHYLNRFGRAVFGRLKAIALITVDIRDIFFFAGLGLLGYGIWMEKPWLAFVVCGTILMLTGYVMKEK